MKTLVSYIRESFQDPILKEYFAYVNKLDGETKRELTALVLRASTNIDFHNVKAVEQSFDTDNTAASIKKYFDRIVSNSLHQTSKSYISVPTFNLFIIKMQKDGVTSFGLVIPYYGHGATKLKELKLFLPNNINEPEYYSMDDLITSCSKLSKLIRQGWSVTVFRYWGDGDNDLSDLYKLRKERKVNKQGVFDNTEEFLSYYKDKKVRNRLLTLIRNASKQVDPDYKAMLDDAKEQVNKLLKFVDVIDRATKNAGRNDGIKNDSSLNSSLKQIDKNVLEATEILNSPEFYAGSFNRDRFQSRIDSIKSYVEDAYRDMEYVTKYNF